MEEFCRLMNQIVGTGATVSVSVTIDGATSKAFAMFPTLHVEEGKLAASLKGYGPLVFADEPHFKIIPPAYEHDIAVV